MMQTSRIRPLLMAAVLFGVALGTAAPAAAQSGNWPARPMKLVVPYPAGGNSDAIGRFIANGLARALGQPFVVENRAGAGATIGAEAVARAPGDGYTFLLAPTAVVAITPHLRKVPYDPFTDFVPIAKLSGSYSIATARKNAPFNNLKELVAAAGKQPGKFTFGSAGPATATHIAGEMLHHAAGIRLLHVPYKGSADSLNDLVAGRIDMIYDPVSLTQVKAGNVKAIAIMSKKRHPDLPDVATVTEQGYPVDTRSWFGLFAPKGTPQPVVERIAAEVDRILSAEETRQLLLKMSQYPDYVAPAAFAREIREDSAAFKDLIVRAQIQGE